MFKQQVARNLATMLILTVIHKQKNKYEVQITVYVNNIRSDSFMFK